MRGRRHARSWKAWLVAGVVALAIVLAGGPYVYIHFIEGMAPAPLALASPSPSTSEARTGTSTPANNDSDGTWKVSNGSLVGYRVKEVLFGQSNEAVGRTGAITGAITVDGTTIRAGDFTVDLRTVASDQSRRDAQFNGRIMDTGTYPTATFTMTKAIDLQSIPAQGTQRTYQATGTLTLHGVTKTVTFKVTGRYSGSAVQVAGSIPITFADWNIPNPSFGPVSTEDHGVLEFSLSFARSA